ncbi:hypothetical protein K488DRAFT_84111 [Vararia minispora EC-137]|uniref:Uncharacterized protein n=1 Tax=Vararia minispora EC-137 TaxID=1314806 RepID=A0ACB8QQV2_9AGAM|nr:hypothetical protein K488DRAFT_84111 [Vararia minispora EC-137]
MPKSVASIDSSVHPEDDHDDRYDDEDYEDEYELQKEWEESLRQLAGIFSVVLLPYLGKWLGRRYAHQVWA